MNVLKYLILGFISLLFACTSKSNDPSPNTTTVDVGTIRYTNNSSKSSYNIYLDGSAAFDKPLTNGYYYDKTNVTVGSHIVKAVQYNGYAVYPTVVEKTITVSKGTIIEFNFP